MIEGTRFGSAGRLLLVCLVLGSFACEHLPTDSAGLDALQEVRQGGALNLSLHDLFTASLVRVRTGEGSDSAEAILARWNALRAGADDTIMAARPVEAETVVRAFGPGIADQALTVLRAEWQESAARVERSIAEGARSDALRPSLETASRELARAQVARRTSATESLLASALAADRLRETRRAIQVAERMPVLEELFATAVARTRRVSGPSAAQSIIEEQGRMTADAVASVDTLGLGEEHQRLQSVREYQARVCSEALGMDAIRDYVERIEAGTRATEAVLKPLPISTEVTRFKRMQAAITNLTDRARAALVEGDSVRSLDLATHAAGLLNTLRDALQR
jgi:hypothetical protein